MEVLFVAITGLLSGLTLAIIVSGLRSVPRPQPVPVRVRVQRDPRGQC